MIRKMWRFSLDDLISNPLSRKVLKVVIGLTFLGGGFILTRYFYFKKMPLFGINFLAESIFSIPFYFFGYLLIPRWLLYVKNWIEQLITKIISDIVSAFWTQQCARITEERRKKAVSKTKKQVDAETKLTEQMKGAVLLDTSVLIDGRIIYIAKAGFISGNLVILKSVINELHTMSDSADDQKRQKGKRGLDNISKLKKVSKVLIPDLKATEGVVDTDLVTTAKTLGTQITTLDFNLNKVAKAMGISVLNINELVEALKKVVVPGELIQVTISVVGKEKDQGVGYLDDGTMVVVAGGAGLVGQQVTVKVTKVIQSQAGKMVFCERK